VLTTGEDGTQKWDGDSAFCQGKTNVGSRIVDSADMTRALGDDAKLMVW